MTDTPTPLQMPAPSKSPVCFLVTTEVTVDNRVRREALALADAGYPVTVFCISGGKTRRPLTHPNIRIHRLTAAEVSKWKPWSLKHQYWLLRAATCGTRFAVVHCHDANTLPIGAKLAQWHGAQLVYDAHEYWASVFRYRTQFLTDETKRKCDRIKAKPASPLNSLKLALKQRFLKRRLRHINATAQQELHLIRQADAVISVGQAIVSCMTKDVQGQIQRSLALRNTPETFITPTTTGQRPRHFHHAYSLPDTTVVLLYQGVIAEIRGFGVLLDAFAQLNQPDTAPDTALVFMGPIADPLVMPRWERFKADHPDLAQRVFLKEPVYGDDFLHWTASADLGLAPIQNVRESYYYCLPNKVFEYIQAEVPMGVSNFPELTALVNEYAVGFTFTPDDSEAICQALKTFLDQKAAGHSYHNALSQAKAELCWENEQRKLIDLYCQLLA